MKKPNIILITLHDLGTCLPIYDSELPETPNISKFASGGLVFENHFSTAPLCSPARASIQTGTYPHINGMNGLTHRGFKMNSEYKCIAHFLGDNGYHTALCGHQHETSGHPAELGYKELLRESHIHEDCRKTIDKAMYFLRKIPSKPFFLSLGFREVHRPFKDFNRIEVDPNNVKVPPYLIDCNEVRSDLSDFYGVIEHFDQAFGLLLDELEKLHLMQDTFIIFTTDHGAAFPRAKSTLYDQGIRVSFMVNWKGHIAPGRVNGLTSHVDILPTILDLADIKKPEYFSGRSIVKLFEKPNSKINDFIFAEKSWHGNEYDPMRCVRNDRWKYIINVEQGYLYQSPLDIRQSLSGQAMEPSRIQQRPSTELYDVQNDPFELKNLSGTSKFKDVENKMRSELLRWMSRTSDQVLEKPIPWPSGKDVHFLNNMDYTQ